MKFLLFWLLLGGMAAAQTPELPTLPPVPAAVTHGGLQLTIEEALERAFSSNPEMLAANARVRSAYWSYQKASSLPSTQLSVGTITGSNTPGSEPGTPNPNGAGAGFATYASTGLTDTYVQVTQPFLPLGSFATGRELALQDYRMAVASYQRSQLQLRRQVKDAFYGLLSAQEIVKVTQRNLELAQESYTIAEKRLQAGAGPRLDFLDAGVLLARAQQEVVKARSQWKQAQASLAPVLNLSAEIELISEGHLELQSHHWDFPVLLQQAAHNPQIQAALHALERSRQEVLLARQQAHPTPALTFIRDISTHTYQVQLGLQFPLDWGQIRTEVRAREEGVTEQEQNLLNARLDISSRLKIAYEQYQGALQNATAFREKVLEPSEESTRITQYGFKRGAVPYLRLLTSQQNLALVRREYTELLQSFFLAGNALEAAVGAPPYDGAPIAGPRP